MEAVLTQLASLFLIEPLLAEFSEKLTAARVPREVMAEALTCMRGATPVLIEKATTDVAWAISSIAGVWFGTSQPEAILIEAVPSCSAAVDAVRPYLAGG